MKIIKTSNFDRVAAEVISDNITNALEDKDSVILGLVGGKSVPDIYRSFSTSDTNWGKVDFFMVDDRLVPIDAHDSNFHLAKTSFLDSFLAKGIITESQLHPYVHNRDYPNISLKQYSDELVRCGGFFDVAVISVGEDGHIGALYPKHHSVNDPTRYFIAMSDSPKPPRWRMTASLSLLKKCKHVILLFKGVSKKEVFNKFLVSHEPLECPAVILKRVKDLTVITDLDIPSGTDVRMVEER